MEMALLRGVKIQIITQDEPDSELLADHISSWKKRELPISLTRAIGESASVNANFAVMDQTAFRFEPNRNEPKAFASMNDTRIAKQLDEIFYGRMAALV